MIMLCSLAVSDFLVGLIIFIAKELLKEDRYVNHISDMSGYSLCGFSFLTMTAISVDRFLALHYHMRYATLVTESSVKCILIIIWLISFLSSGFPFLSERLHSFIVGAAAIICLIISTFSNIRINRIVLRHQIQIHAEQRATTGNNLLNIVRLKRSAMNTFMFYIALIICYLPLYILLTLYGLSIKDWETEWQFAYTAVSMKSFINLILYCWRLRELRTAVVKTARQMLCKQTDENQSQNVF